MIRAVETATPIFLPIASLLKMNESKSNNKLSDNYKNVNQPVYPFLGSEN
ncbi:hypothetical protein J31TS6_51790 [Brevibacillus reuszeri]|nr:hypothetical protein J31TS6_51790 [Brevibacillus reuszeri]